VLKRTIIPSRVLAVNSPLVRIRYRRTVAANGGSKLLHYAKYVTKAALLNARANISFVLHGADLWLSTRALTNQFWSFLAVCFFLTSGSRSTFSSSICF
jgi:hypothetical protein